jgi:hypothetical protein
MDKNELERRLEAAEKQNLGLLDELKNLKAQLAEMQDEPEIPDFPEFARNETYWYAGADLNGVDSGFALGTIDDDYNVFHAKEMAQEFANKCKLIAMMLHCKWYLDRDFVPDWNNCDDKFTVWYNHLDDEWTFDYQEIHEAPTIYFSTEEAAQKCADWLNKHWRDCDD